MAEVWRRMGISEQTLTAGRRSTARAWRGKLRRVTQLGDENRNLNQLVADLSLEKHTLQECAVKKSLRTARQREIVPNVQPRHAVSERRSCAVLRFIAERKIPVGSSRSDASAHASPVYRADPMRYSYVRRYILLRRCHRRCQEQDRRGVSRNEIALDQLSCTKIFWSHSSYALKSV